METRNFLNVDDMQVGDIWVNGEDEQIRVLRVEPCFEDMTRIVGRIATGPDASRRTRTWVWPNTQRMEVRRWEDR